MWDPSVKNRQITATAATLVSSTSAKRGEGLALPWGEVLGGVATLQGPLENRTFGSVGLDKNGSLSERVLSEGSQVFAVDVTATKPTTALCFDYLDFTRAVREGAPAGGPEDKLRTLRSSFPFFDELPLLGKLQVFYLAQQIFLPPRAVVFKQNQPEGQVYFLHSGSCEVHYSLQSHGAVFDELERLRIDREEVEAARLRFEATLIGWTAKDATRAWKKQKESITHYRSRRRAILMEQQKGTG